MRFFATGTIALLLALSAGNAECADEETSTRMQGNGGTKLWVNTWKNKQPDSGTVKSNNATLIGWEVDAVFSNRMFVELGYLQSASYYTLETATPRDIARSDFDFAVGYQVRHAVGAFVGFRSSQFWDYASKDKETVSGPLVGLRGKLRLYDRFSFYYKMVYLPFSDRETFTTTEMSEKARGWFVASGIRYGISKRFTGALGYKYGTSMGANTKVRDSFGGATLDVLYSFQ